MIKYSPYAAKALSYLKRPYNDVDIYVEDTANPNMWLVLIRQMLPQELRLYSVNVLGGRDRVLAACKLDQSTSSRPKLYIIDSDFDFLLAKKKPKLKYLYRIRAYCVENLLVRERAVVSLGMICQPKLTEGQLSAKFDFENWLGDTSKILTPLFVAYAVAHALSPGTQTVGHSVSNLYVQRSGLPHICPIKTRKRTLEITRTTIRSAGFRDFCTTYAAVKNQARKCSRDQVISGKDYVFPLFLIRARKLLGYRGTTDQLKAMLANSWDATADPWLARRIRCLAS